ncbi:AAA family ATPase [Pseudanabaena minima]|uniref:AAA family ATPase n=1 Tax=Pseudanabaena minima TaxID=890415 RepID=UPI003DA83823
MQKIIIKNFGAIEYAEIEIKKVLVLIGEQASGKSTIAKLIYFFKSLRDDVFNQIYQDQERDYFDENLDVISVLQEKFYNWFGSTKNFKDDFEIKFYFDFELDKSLVLSLSQDKEIQCKFSSIFFDNKFKDLIGESKKFLQSTFLQSTSDTDKWISHGYKLSYARIISDELNKVFNNCYQVDSLFVIAGRSATVSYSELFERELFASIKSRLQRNNDLKYHLKTPAVDEILMLEFISKILNNKVYLKDLKSSFSEYDISNYILAKKKVFEILKGEYIDENGEEKIILNSRESIYLRNASSGQQEVIRILQDIIVVMCKHSKILRILEEPEAHLFPVAQKSLIELLALMVNQNDDNQLIITTHSPYVLTVFNNLLFAQRVVDKNPSSEAEVAEMIPKQFWLNPNEFSAYSLGNSSIEEEPEYCESIFNSQTGAIKQNYLDAVSEMLGGDFNALYSIYTKNSRRR